MSLRIDLLRETQGGVWCGERCGSSTRSPVASSGAVSSSRWTSATVARARDGYLDAYELLVQRHSAMAYRVALRLTGNHHDAQDVAQEALIAAWEGLDRFQGGSSFSTWLYQIVTRRALNKVTRGRDTGSLDLLPEIPDPALETADKAERDLAGDAVTGALLGLPFAQRTVIVLHHFEGLSYAEIASVTGATEPAVRSHLFRARRALAKTLEEWK